MESVFITGGSRGIGAALVREFTERGYKTAFIYKENRRAAEAVSRRTGALAIQCDVSDPDQVQKAANSARIYLEIPWFDTLICNAAISHTGLFSDLSDDQWKKLFDTNLMGCVYAVRALLSPMIQRGQGSIVMISSVWGQAGASCETSYASSKAAVIGLTKSLAKELAPSGVRVNCLAPGVIDTDMNHGFSAETMQALKEEIPLGRIGKPEEVAKAAAFLASEDASYITGQILAVNGGFYI